MDIKIRQSTKDDWKHVQRLNIEVYENSFQFDSHMDHQDPYSESSIKEYQDDVINPNKFCVLAEVDGNPVGYLVGSENNLPWRTNKRGEIHHMGVSPAYRSHGIGSMLVKEFKSWCLSRGITHLAATAYFADSKAREFYERQGLSPIDVSLEGEIKI